MAFSLAVERDSHPPVTTHIKVEDREPPSMGFNVTIEISSTSPMPPPAVVTQQPSSLQDAHSLPFDVLKVCPEELAVRSTHYEPSLILAETTHTDGC